MHKDAGNYNMLAMFRRAMFTYLEEGFPLEAS